MNSDEKKKYQDGAAKEKTRYQEELRIYRINKDKEKEEKHDEYESLDDVDRPRSKRSSRISSRKIKSEEDERRCRPNTSSTPSGLTIEYVKKKKSHPSRLRGKRYKPVNFAEFSSRSHSLDQICPLPLSFDASRCHPSEIVSEKEMMQAVSPLLKNPPPPPVFRESNDRCGHQCYEDKSPIPSIQTAASNISACSLNSTGTGNDNEMADILTFFLKDGEVDTKHEGSNNRILDENVCAI